MGACDLSIIIVNWNVREYLRACLYSIKNNHAGLSIEIFVVDNNSSDSTGEMIRRDFPDVILIENTTNVGFAKANNQALKRCSGRTILLLNPDTLVLPGTLKSMVDYLDSHERTGAVGCKVLDPDDKLGTFRTHWLQFPTLKHELIAHTFLEKLYALMPKVKNKPDATIVQNTQTSPLTTEWVSGCCIMLRAATITQVGMLDENLTLYMEDIELCYRIKRLYHWDIALLPGSAIVHYGGKSTGQMDNHTVSLLHVRSLYYFMKKYQNGILLVLMRAARSMILAVELCARLILYAFLGKNRTQERARLLFCLNLLKITSGTDSL